MIFELAPSILLIWAVWRLLYRFCCGLAGAARAVSRGHREVPRDDKRRASGVRVGLIHAVPVSEGASWTQIEAYTKRAEGVPRP